MTIGLFDEGLFQEGVLSSIAIQSRYKKACETSKRKATIGLYNLLEPPIFSTDFPAESTEEMPIPPEVIAESSEEMQQRKEKEIKVTPPISTEIVPPLESSEV